MKEKTNHDAKKNEKKSHRRDRCGRRGSLCGWSSHGYEIGRAAADGCTAERADCRCATTARRATAAGNTASLPATGTPPPQAAEPAPTGLTDEGIAQLKQLGQLHESGVLTDAEFEASKQKILGI